MTTLGLRFLTEEQYQNIVKALAEVQTRIATIESDLKHEEDMARATGNIYIADRLAALRERANL